METYPRRRDDVTSRMVEGEVVVLDRRHELVHQFNATASFIWERCNGTATAADIAAQLTQAFDVPLATACTDVEQVLQQLQALQLLEVPPDQSVYASP
jgi:hypothetical protein